MNIVNLTPHTINLKREYLEYCPVCGLTMYGEWLCNECGTQTVDSDLWLEIPPSGTVARVDLQEHVAAHIDGLPVLRTAIGTVENLPEPQKDTIYIVSSMVLAQTDREDVFAPGRLVRDDAGRVIGAAALITGRV